MKKILLITIISTFMLTLVACGGSNKDLVGEDILGDWVTVDLLEEGVSYYEDLGGMSIMDITLNEGGHGVVTALGDDEFDVLWELEGNKVIMDDGIESLEFTINGEQLIAEEYDGITIILEKE